MEAEDWLYLARDNRHMWPLQMTSHSAAAQISTEKFMRREPSQCATNSHAVYIYEEHENHHYDSRERNNIDTFLVRDKQLGP